MQLTDEQTEVVARVEAWLEGPEQTMTFGGLAGTGKTTVISQLLQDREASVCAFTGKAAHVLRGKGVEGASTIHGLIYKAVEKCSLCNKKIGSCQCKIPVKRVEFQRRQAIDAEFIIVDEASMVSRAVRLDLERFGVKILYVGDHGQLPPIGDDEGIMANPDVRLETIHRQAAGSPIVQMAHHIREGNEPKTFGDNARVIDAFPKDLTQYDAILCGYNRTRCALNFRVRRELGHDRRGPLVGELVTCLKNSSRYGLFNGQICEVTDVDPKDFTLTVLNDMGLELPELPFWGKQFGAPKTCKDAPRWVTLWDYGYATTVHRSQGSQYDNVLVVDEQCDYWEADRWRYTAATRAAKRLDFLML